MSQTEQGRIFQWAEKNCTEDFLLQNQKNSDKKSYFDDFDDTENFSEYQFANLPALQMQLYEMWRGESALEEISLTAAIAAFKARSSRKTKKITGVETVPKEIDVPDFIYAF